MYHANPAGRHRPRERVHAKISRDRMEAALTIESPEPVPEPADPNTPQPAPAPVTGEEIRRAVDSAGVRYGLDTSLLDQLSADPQPGEYVIARGLAPENGLDGNLVYHFTRSCEPHPKELSDGRVDYRHLGLIQNVHRGDMLCTTLPPTEGKPGRDVTGASIAQKAGRAAVLPAGENTSASADGTILTATLSGQVSLSGSSIRVLPTYTVNGDVDFSTGNIDFVGNVHICGSVHEGFHIHANGSVEVDGMVDGGSVEADGDILIHQGIIGHGNSIFSCKGNFAGNFMENCTVHCDGNVTAASMMHCSVVCVGSIRLLGTRARIVGGHYLSAANIEAGNIGSPSGAITELKLGETPSLVEQSHTLEGELEILRTRVAKLEEILTLLERKKGAMKEDERQAVLQTTNSTIAEIREEQQKREKQFQELAKRLSFAGRGTVTARETICRGTHVTIGSTSEVLRETRSHVVLRQTGRTLAVDSLEK